MMTGARNVPAPIGRTAGDIVQHAVVRSPNWLGDTVMALPALRALRAAMPDARITLVGRWASLLVGQGVADVLLPYPAAWPERRRFNHTLGADGADVAILLVNSLEAGLAARQWKARRRIGFDTDARRALLTDAVALPDPRRHQAEEYALLLAPVGVAVTDTTPSWRPVAASGAEAEIDRLLAEIDAPRGRLVGLHLGASFGRSKLWPAESFARLASRLDAVRLVPVLLGAPADRDVAAAVAAASRRAPPSLVGRDRPSLLPRLLSRLSCVVSGDTGIAHLAAALGVPTVTLFGPTDPRLTAPRAPTAHVVARSVPCAPCFLRSCPIEHPCLRSIEPEEVERLVRRAAAA